MKGLPLRTTVVTNVGASLPSGVKLPEGMETVQVDEVLEVVQGPIPADALAVPDGFARVEPPAEKD
jgi:hypothetical protein